jgi:3-oxoacyl-ACP reductase-like protein
MEGEQQVRDTAAAAAAAEAFTRNKPAASVSPSSPKTCLQHVHFKPAMLICMRLASSTKEQLQLG